MLLRLTKPEFTFCTICCGCSTDGYTFSRYRRTCMCYGKRNLARKLIFSIPSHLSDTFMMLGLYACACIPPHHDRASDGEDGNRRTVMGRGCIIDRQCGTAIVHGYKCYSFCLLENELRSCTFSLVLRCCTMILLHLVLSSANLLPASYVYVSCVPSRPAIKYSHNGLYMCMYVCLEANKMNIAINKTVEVTD